MAKELSDICLSYEKAKELVDAGVVIESYARWCIVSQRVRYDPKMDGVYVLMNANDRFFESNKLLDGDDIPAPTAEEVDLPNAINDGKSGLRISHIGNQWVVSYGQESYYAKSHKLCEALADMILWLKSEGYR